MVGRNEILALFDLAHARGYDIIKDVSYDHYRLIDRDGNLVKRGTGSVAFSYAEARRFLEAIS